MSAPPGTSPQNAASSVAFPVATVGVAGMTAAKIAHYALLQAGYRAGWLGSLDLVALQVYVRSIHQEVEERHREVALNHRALEREIEAAYQAQQPAASTSAPASAPTRSPAASGDFLPAAPGFCNFTDAHVTHYYQLQDEYRARTISEHNLAALQTYVNVLHTERLRDPVAFEAATTARAPTRAVPDLVASAAAVAPVAANAKAPRSRTAASERAPPPARKRKSESKSATSSTSGRRTPSKASDPALIRLIVRLFDPVDASDMYTLLRFSRISKAWRTPALQRLHATVPIFSPQSSGIGSLFEHYELTRAMRATDLRGKGEKGSNAAPKKKAGWSDSEEENEEGPGNGPARKALDKAAMRLYRTYAKFPSLAALPIELLFYGPFEFKTAGRALRRFLTVCPNIRKLRLNFLHRGFIESPYQADLPGGGERYEPHALVLRYAAEAQPLLQSIELARVSARNWEMIPALRAFKELKHLSITYGDEGQAVELSDRAGRASRRRSWEYEYSDEGLPDRDVGPTADAEPETYPFQLESLELNSPTEQGLLDRLTEASKTSLTSLCVGIMRTSLDLSAFPNLRKVAIVCGEDTYALVVKTIETMPESVDFLEIRETETFTELAHRGGCCGGFDDEDLDPYYDGDYEADEVEERKHRRAEQVKLAEQNTFAVLLANIPNRIRHLAFTFYLAEVDRTSPRVGKDEQTLLVAALARPDFLPNLVQLEVADPTTDERFEDWETIVALDGPCP
ncbi:hypothetical protein JCM8115_003851 [Rhodotorula mucilaginosa]